MIRAEAEVLGQKVKGKLRGDIVPHDLDRQRIHRVLESRIHIGQSPVGTEGVHRPGRAVGAVVVVG